MAIKRIRAWIGYLVYLMVVTLGLLLCCEGVLRIGFGRPEGLFHIRPLNGESLYYPSSTIRIYTGPIPYTVETNALGFRGAEISKEKPAGTTRIIALGDSVTDGFYVENENTYPFQLEEMLREAGHTVEVVNAARGESSIDREIDLYNRFCASLQPDIVVLTFVTNDIDAIRGVPREKLIHPDMTWKDEGEESEALLLASTALGEMLLDLSLRSRFENYRRFDRESGTDRSDNRYTIPGNDDYAENLRFFKAKYTEKSDSILLYDTFDETQMRHINNYLFALEFFRDQCRAAGITLILTYTPGYNQLHDPKSSMLLRDLIEQGCQRLEVPFLDMTPRFREAVKERPVTLAPRDFHPNPYGNWVMADETANFLNSKILPVK